LLPCFAFGYAGHSRFSSYAGQVQSSLYELRLTGQDTDSFVFSPIFNGLKAQLILAQGNALGLPILYTSPCNGSLSLCLLSCPYRAQQKLLIITLGVA